MSRDVASEAAGAEMRRERESAGDKGQCPGYRNWFPRNCFHFYT